jgi:hypothetical protein
MENSQEESISEKIISAAESGKLKMRSKRYFVLRAVLWLAGVVIAAAALLYFFSLFVFITRETGIWVTPIFGRRGIFLFLTSLPWLLLFLLLIFIVTLEVLVRRYAFAYRLPLLYSALAILLVVVAGGLLLERTPLHSTLSHCPPKGDWRQNRPDPANLPPCGTGIYRDLGHGRFENIHYGMIESEQNGGFVMINRQQEKINVAITERTRLPFGKDFSPGDFVVVVGDRRADQVEAFGISDKINW